jgi:C4-dicarboxylate-specific signal transduction histidine kinase
MNAAVALNFLVGCFLLVAACLPPAPLPAWSAQAGLLGLLGLALDARCERTPGGYFRVSLPFFWGLGLLGWQPLGAVLGVFGVMLLPNVRNEGNQAAWTLALLAAGLLCTRWLPPMWAVVALSVFYTAVESQRLQGALRDIQGRRLRRVLLPFTTVLPWTTALVASGPVQALVAGFVLVVLSEGLVNAIYRVYAVQASEAIQRLDTSEQRLDAVRQQLSEQQTHTALEARQRHMVERLAEQIAQGPDFASTQRAILDTLGKLFACRSVSLFLWEPVSQRLDPASWRTPDAPRVHQAMVNGLRDPLVELCWKRQKLVQRAGDGTLRSQIFPAEEEAVAVPLAETGVLYVGREAHAWSSADCRTLEWVAEKALLGLRAAIRHSQQQQQQMEQTSINVQLREHVLVLQRLVQGSGWLSAQLNVEGALRAVEQELRQLLPHQLGAVFRGQPGDVNAVHQWTCGPVPPLPDEALRGVAMAAVQRATPIVYSDLLQQQLVGEGQLRSLLCVPLQFPSRKTLALAAPGGEAPAELPLAGALLVAAAEPHAYGPEQLHLLSLLALQLGVTLRNAGLYEEVQLAKQQLELSQAQLIQSSKLTAIGQLAAGVAHELNTPLGAVALSVDLMSGQLPAGNSYVKNAHAAIERAQSIVDKLLVYSRRTGDAEKEAVSLVEVVESACDLAQARLRQYRVALNCELDQDAWVLAKSVELQQVVVNLVLNAVDAYADEVQERPLRVVTGRTKSSGFIEVQDFAGGIPEEIQGQIFDPFFTTKPIGKGTGLGLSISKEICDLYGGELTFVTAEGTGTTFTMTFPLVRPGSD